MMINKRAITIIDYRKDHLFKLTIEHYWNNKLRLSPQAAASLNKNEII